MVLPGQPPACSRWFFPTESLLAQAFPVHPIINKGWKVCPFNFPRAQRKSRQVCAQAGNSMSIVCTYVLCMGWCAIVFQYPRTGSGTGRLTLLQRCGQNREDEEAEHKRVQIPSNGLNANTQEATSCFFDCMCYMFWWICFGSICFCLNKSCRCR